MSGSNPALEFEDNTQGNADDGHPYDEDIKAKRLVCQRDKFEIHTIDATDKSEGHKDDGKDGKQFDNLIGPEGN